MYPANYAARSTFIASAKASASACVPTSTSPTPDATVSMPASDAPASSAEAVATEAPAPTGSTCDNAREAILTGSPSDITKAMKALVADKSAPDTAREYARYYNGRDKGDPTMQEMDVSLIQMACS